MKATTINERRQYLDDLRASGESVAEWCKKTGLHHTTVYRWRRDESRNNTTNQTEIPVEAEVGEHEEMATPAAIRWIRVNENRVTGNDNKKHDESKRSVVDTKTADEIRVQIGSFTIITPEDFKQGTFETICKSLLTIC